MKIDWYPDECSQPLPRVHNSLRRQAAVLSPPKQATTAVNRFQMLGLDTEDDSSEDDDAAPLSQMSTLKIDSHTPWNSGPIAA